MRPTPPIYLDPPVMVIRWPGVAGSVLLFLSGMAVGFAAAVVALPWIGAAP